MLLLHDSGLSNNLWENHALADKIKKWKMKKKRALAEQSLLHALISASFCYSVLCYKEMPGSSAISRQQSTCCKCSSGGGWAARAPVPWTLQTALFWEGLPLQPATGPGPLPSWLQLWRWAVLALLDDFPAFLTSQSPLQGPRTIPSLQLSFHPSLFHTVYTAVVARTRQARSQLKTKTWRNAECLGFKGTFKTIHFQLPCLFQVWDIHHFSG